MKNLLIDASKTTIDPTLDEAEYESIVTSFAQALAKTRLQKSARVVSKNQARETKAKELSAEVVKATQLNIHNQNFPTRS
ncbi:hypothetical protein [Adhaeribacter aquaticus]|uniref:hypothetical protein n=1 Tax=Adhaeribacter aquaticus TaxID=299567 RepID=UPI000409CD46|nr:hypothetical protein [Adhaeribacter aquaticus]